MGGRISAFLKENKSRLFWKYFLSYFIIIIIPVITAGAMTYFNSVKKLQAELEKSNFAVIDKFSSNTDELINSLSQNIFDILSSPSVTTLSMKNLNISEKESADRNMLVLQALQDLNNSLYRLVSYREMVQGAYIYFAEKQVVLAIDGVYDSSHYFKYINKYEDITEKEFQYIFSQKQVLNFLKTSSVSEVDFPTNKVTATNRYVPVVTGYPLTSAPKVFLVVNIKEDSLRNHIKIGENSNIETLILDSKDNIVSQSGKLKVDSQEINKVIGQNKKGSVIINEEGKKLHMSYVSSTSNQWRYISLIELKELRKPAQSVKNMAVIFIVFFTAIGVVVSYLMSNRMYTPIRHIKNSFEQSGSFLINQESDREKNEFDLIENWSRDMIHKNREMTQQINEMKPLIQESFIYKLLKGEIKDRKSAAEYAGKIGLDIETEGKKTVFTVEMQYYSDTANKLSENDKALLVLDIKNKIQEAFQKRVWFCDIAKGEFACIVPLKDNTFEQEQISKAQSVKEILSQYNEFFKATVGMGQVVEDICDTDKAFSEALRMLEFKYLTPEVEILSESVIAERIYSEYYLSEEQIGELMSSVRARDSKAVNDSINSILDNCEEKRITAKNIFQVGKDILNTLLRGYKIINKNDVIFEKSSVFLQELNQCLDINELKNYFERVCSELIGISESRDDKRDIFSEVIGYIQCNYKEDISLEFFAERYNMSAGYFSRQFKEVIGEKYVDYVNICRIQNAKKLLIHTDKKIDEISSEVGYIGSNSFNAIFKKYEGITPGRFRTQHKL